jgi:hypothetical protein
LKRIRFFIDRLRAGAGHCPGPAPCFPISIPFPQSKRIVKSGRGDFPLRRVDARMPANGQAMKKNTFSKGLDIAFFNA